MRKLLRSMASRAACAVAAMALMSGSVAGSEPAVAESFTVEMNLDLQETCPIQMLMGKLLKLRKGNAFACPQGAAVVTVSVEEEDDGAACEKAAKCCKSCPALKACCEKSCDPKECNSKACAEKGCCKEKECCESKGCCKKAAGECESACRKPKEPVGEARVRTMPHPHGGMVVISSGMGGWQPIAVSAPPHRGHSPHLPDDMQVTIQKKGHKPARVIVKQGEKSWSTTENELDMLPPESRMTVMRMLGKPPAVAGAHMPAPGPGFQVVPFPNPAAREGHAGGVPGLKVEMHGHQIPGAGRPMEAKRPEEHSQLREQKMIQRIHELEQMVDRLRRELEGRRAESEPRRPTY